MSTWIPVHRPHFGPEEAARLGEVLQSRWLGKGAQTQEFEDALRATVGARHALAVISGTAALHVALLALELQPDDEVLVPSLTFVSTIQAIVTAGGRPVFCDVHAETLNIDLDDAMRRATPRARAIVPVHYGGQPCDMNRLLPWARERGICVVEDAAHAFGSTYGGKPVGTLGDMTCFSFDPIKNITTGGGGAVLTDNDEYAARIVTLRNVGIELDSWSRIQNPRNWQYHVTTTGYRYLLPNMNAVVGLCQLQRLDMYRERKREIVRRYNAGLAGAAHVLTLKQDIDTNFPFNYVVRVQDGRRDEMMGWLLENQIGSTIQFIPNHTQPAFAEFRNSLPMTEKLYDEILTLPLYYEMTDADVDRVIDRVLAFATQPAQV